MSTVRTTAVLGILGLVAVLVPGWLLVLAPRMGAPGELEAQAQAIAAANAATREQIRTLQKEADRLPQAEARAAVLSAKFPPDIAQPELYDLLRAAAAEAGLPEQAITDVAPTVPVVGGADGSVTLPDTAAPEIAADGSAEASEPTTTTPPSTGASTVATTSVDLTVTGPRDRLLRFVRELEELDRAYLMGEVSIGGVATDSAGGYTLTVSGSMFMLPPLLDPAADGTADQGTDGGTDAVTDEATDEAASTP